MLDGTFFYVDRLEGLGYCDQCVQRAPKPPQHWPFVLRCCECDALQPPTR